MPLEDATTSREPDGDFHEEYCKWCYSDGTFTYSSKEQLIDFCVAHMSSENWPPEQVRVHMEAVLPQPAHWKKYTVTIQVFCFDERNGAVWRESYILSWKTGWPY